MSRVIICGGGLSGGLAAIALAKRRPDVELLLIEGGGTFGGNHIWSSFDSDVDEDCRWLLGLIAARRWPDHEIHFPRRQRILPVGYNSIQSHDFDAAVRTALTASQYRLRARVTQVGPTHVVADGERIDGDCVIDARGMTSMAQLDLGWQKFVGRTYRFARPHGVVRPMLMDATVAQVDGFRFIYRLPLSATELLIEDTYYSSSPLLDAHDIGIELNRFADGIDSDRGEIVPEERGVLPVILGGQLGDLWPESDLVPRLGLSGGFFHPTTGYSLPDALRTAVLLAQQDDFSAQAVSRRLRDHAQKAWHDRRFFQLLNRMLFRAAEPAERYRVLEHFYRLPANVVSRFYSAKLSGLDKLRILSGRPPVSLGRALHSLRRAAA